MKQVVSISVLHKSATTYQTLLYHNKGNDNSKANNSLALVRERTIPTGRPPLVGEVSTNFLWIEECRVVNAVDPYGRILGFIDRSSYFFFQVAPQLYSQG
jgi:hypothetical protein